MPSTSIVLVHFRTPRQIRLCLRSLRRHTALHDTEVIVVDNGSGERDPGLRWLRTLGWIRLLEDTHPMPSHQRALDLGVARSRGELICVLHSDTYVHRSDWLPWLVQRLGAEAAMAGCEERVLLPLTVWSRIGAWSREQRRRRRWARRGMTPKLLTHCALYRRELFDDHHLRFDVPERQHGRFVDTGEPIQRFCEREGLGVVRLRGVELARRVWHFEGATLNAVRRRPLVWKRRWRARRFWRRPEVRALLADDRLDR